MNTTLQPVHALNHVQHVSLNNHPFSGFWGDCNYIETGYSPMTDTEPISILVDDIHKTL
jgi:hypothetical protein